MNPVEASASSAEKILLAATDLFAANHTLMAFPSKKSQKNPGSTAL
ncbi:hypothetical protein [Phascolarctobacterium faecium]